MGGGKKMNLTLILGIYLLGIFAGVIFINLNKILILSSFSKSSESDSSGAGFGFGKQLVLSGKGKFSNDADFSIKTLIFVNINAFAWILAGYIYEMSIKLVIIAFLITIATLISFTDLSVRKIPNIYVAVMGIIGFAVMFTGIFNISAGMHIAGFITGSLIFMVPYLLNQGVGAGDVKFLAAIGLILGFENMLLTVMIMGISIILFVLGMIIVKRDFRQTMKLHIPLGPFISIGFVASLLASNI